MNGLAPGTNMSYNSNTLTALSQLIAASNGLTLGQICNFTDLEPSTIQNWVRRRFVPRPVGKKYRERHIARILLISSLRDCMKLDNIGKLMTYVNGDTDDESDDIISEQKLYGYLCEAISRTDNAAPTIDSVSVLVKSVTESYDAPEEHKRRLENALAVMVCAYTAGKYKRQAEKIFNQIKE